MMIRNRLLVISAVFLLTMLTTTAFGADRCTAFGGTIYAWHDGNAWTGEGNFTVGRTVMHAKIRDVNTSIERQADMWLGTETASFDFGDGNTVDLITEFTTEHMTNPTGIFHVNEIGTFANGKGSFKRAYGHFNSQGPFGPGVVLPKGKVAPPAGVKLFWIGHYDGTICWE